MWQCWRARKKTVKSVTEADDKMKKVEIYTTKTCGYCYAAKRLLNKKGISFKEMDVAGDPVKRAEMTQRSAGGRTVPQIFVGDIYVGGCDELYSLEHAGKLEPLLNGL